MERNRLLKIVQFASMCFMFILPSNALPFHHNYCKSDSDCHQPNFYCYESRECVECTKCSFYNRQNNPAIKCAKNKDECGECTLGMEAELNFDGTFTCNPTLPIPPTIPSNNPNPVNDSNNNLGLYISIPVCILASISCLYLINRFKLCSYIKRIIPTNNCPNNNNNTINNRVPPPPPYSEKNPSAPPEEDPLITNQRILHEDNQRANMFHPPNWVTGGTYPSIDPYPPENPPETPASPVADDENTQPSPWSPNSNDLSNSEPTSFSNILSTSTPPDQPDQPPNRSNTHNSQENTESSRSNPSLLIQVNISNNNVMHNAQVINEI